MAKQANRTGGHLWGERRVKAEISIGQLSARSGVPKGNISMMENGRLNPTSSEHAKIMAALEELEAERRAADAQAAPA